MIRNVFYIILALVLAVQVNAKEVPLENKITSLYISFFNRAADEAGLSYWNTTGTNVVKAGGTALSTLKQLSAGFATHPTFTSTYSGMSDEQFVNAIYNNALGRDGDAGGVKYWKGLLSSGKSRSDMVAEFMEISLTADLDNDPQYASLSAADKATAQERQDLITNKVEAAVYFTNTLGTKTNLDPSTDALDPSSLANDAAYLASQRVIADVGLESSSVANSKGKVRTLAYDQGAITSINASWESLVVADNTQPIYTTDWLNGRTLYNTYFDDEKSKWVVYAFEFTDTKWTDYDPDNIQDRDANVPYTITQEGYITFTEQSDGKTNYIKILEENDEYQTIHWTDSLESLKQSVSTDEEYFYFNLENAKALVATKNVAIEPSLNSNTSIYIFNHAAPSVRETQHQIGFGEAKIYESNTPLHCTNYGFLNLILEDTEQATGIHSLSYFSPDMQNLCLEFDYVNANANSGSTNVALYQ